jgi:hypothetical protein
MEALALLWWVGAYATAALVIPTLPHWRGGQFPDGCFLRDRMLFYVECLGTWNDSISGGVLTWAMNWTTQSPAVVPLAVMSITGIPIALAWIASLVLAVRSIVRLSRILLLTFNRVHS